jgi:hypothetical protein
MKSMGGSWNDKAEHSSKRPDVFLGVRRRLKLAAIGVSLPFS